MSASSALAPSLDNLGSARRCAVNSANGSADTFFLLVPCVKSSTFRPDQAHSDARLSTSGLRHSGKRRCGNLSLFGYFFPVEVSCDAHAVDSGKEGVSIELSGGHLRFL